MFTTQTNFYRLKHVTRYALYNYENNSKQGIGTEKILLYIAEVEMIFPVLGKLVAVR